MAQKTIERRLYWGVRQLNMRMEVRSFVLFAILIGKLGPMLLDCPMNMYKMEWE
jgi:hypothetical protein